MAFEKLKILLQRQLAVTPMEARLYPPLRLPMKFRIYEDKDFDALLKIYDLNAPGRFPEDARENFVEYLRGGRKGILVGKLNGQVICTGGLIQNGIEIYTLCYGLIHPEHQRQRIGSTMALLRMAATAERESWEHVLTLIYAVPASIPFYQQFGFKSTGQWRAHDGKDYPIAMAVYRVNDAKRLGTTLAERQITVHGGFEPHRDIRMMTGVKPDEKGRDMLYIEPINQSFMPEK